MYMVIILPATAVLARSPLFEMLAGDVRRSSRSPSQASRPTSSAWTRLATLTVLLGVSGCVAPSDETALKQGAVLDVCATAPEGALCDDGNICTVFDVCKAGVCMGSAAPDGTLCTDGNVCTANDSCRLGSCKGDPVPDTTVCTDGDPCTVGDMCKMGTCVSGAGRLACDDGVACTLDICVAGVGCVFSPVGDCSVPQDAAPEAASDASDGKPSVDVGVEVPADVTMSGGDVASDRPAVPDAPADRAPTDVLSDAVATDVAPADVAPADVAPPVDAPDAHGADAGAGAPDGAMDADAVDGLDAAAAPDAPADVASAPDAGPMLTLPVLRASGGACTCATPEGSPLPGWTLLAFAALAALGRGRARSSRR